MSCKTLPGVLRSTPRKTIVHHHHYHQCKISNIGFLNLSRYAHSSRPATMAERDSADRDAAAQGARSMSTKILPIKPTNLGRFTVKQDTDLPLEDWNIDLDDSSPDAQRIRAAFRQLRDSDIPVAFPTETVYGLGANATRSAAVRGIYRAKQRPADNPLIVHIASITQLRGLLSGSDYQGLDPIPEIYKPLIRRFWPGPLTIILPLPKRVAHLILAPEVTAGLDTFGARMPRNLLALVLIKLANVPVAAPSANASTKPSPTAAEHVLYDLEGRIETIVDGGPCDIGVESTVVDGLSDPPCILRPGGISLDQLRRVPGWEGTVVGYKDVSEKGTKPKAPGMKYRHYSPKATVVLFEAGTREPNTEAIRSRLGKRRRIGVVRTRRWSKVSRGTSDTESPCPARSADQPIRVDGTESHASADTNGHQPNINPIEQMLQELSDYQKAEPELLTVASHDVDSDAEGFEIWDMQLGPETKDVARGLFSALRDLDRKEVDAILVEGIDDAEGDVAAAVMNRLRKAAEIKIESS